MMNVTRNHGGTRELVKAAARTMMARGLQCVQFAACRVATPQLNGSVTGDCVTSMAEPSLLAADRLAKAIAGKLMAAGHLDAGAAERAERAGRKSGERFDRVLSRLGLAPDQAVAEALAASLGLGLMKRLTESSLPLFGDQLPITYLREHQILPIADDGQTVDLAMADPLDDEAANAVAFLLERQIRRLVAVPTDLEAAIGRLGKGGPAAPSAGLPATLAEDVSDDDIDRLRDIASEAPIIRLVQQIITRAVEAEASDIHIEPGEDGLRIRTRIDGLLHTTERLPPGVRAAVTSRIKIMARLNIAERRLPQDGRIKIAVRGKDIDLRVSTMPALHGESVVLRILDRSAVRLDFTDLGFTGPVLAALRAVLKEPNGIVLVTGPTGSGKTTTLYAALAALNDPALKLFTVEDPIEYQLAGVNQIQVQPKIGLSFAAALRSILRQDPDIIMVGEIRDLETAQIAIQSSLTGHLVFSTIHTNSAAATVVRLIDMGIEDYLLASSLTAVLAQRLVRKLCGHCATPHELPEAMLGKLIADAYPDTADHEHARATAKLKKAVGCPHCRQTGFAGRTAIVELLEVKGQVKERISAGASEAAIEAAAIAGGMATMYRDGLVKALAGETTLDEVLQVTRLR